MSSEFPKLKKKLDDIRWEFEKKLQEIIKDEGLEDVELSIDEFSFVERSLISKTTYSLRRTLDECLPISDQKNITKRHILAAQSLLKLHKYQETALKIITEVITNEQYSPSSSISKELQESAIEALGEMSSLDITSNEMLFANCTCSNNIEICTGEKGRISWKHKKC